MAAAPGPPNPAAQPGPPILSKNPSPGMVQSTLNQVRQEQTDGLAPLATTLASILTNIDIVSKEMHTSFNALYNTYTDAVDTNKRALDDITAMADNDQKAAQILAAKEAELSKAKQLQAEAENKKADAEKLFKDLQFQQDRLQQQAAAATQKSKELQDANRQLVALHQTQIVDIHTNIQTLARLREELKKLGDGIENIHQRAIAFGCMKLYIKHPLLIKVRQLTLPALENMLRTLQPPNPLTIQMIQSVITTSRGSIYQILEETKTQLADIVSKIQQPAPAQVSNFWSTYLQKVQDVIAFLASKDPSTNMNGMEYMCYCWIIEQGNNVPIDPGLRGQIDRSKSFTQ